MRLQLNDVLRQGESESLYVLNKSRGNTRGPIIFSANKLNGAGADMLRVPDTFLPINLIEQVQRKQIVDSPEFRSIVANGMLHVIDEDEATTILSKPGVEEELQRLAREKDRVAGATNELMGEMASAMPSNVQQNGRDSATDLNAKMQMILERVPDSGEIAAINSLRSMQDDLTRKDLQHIESWASSRGFKKLENFAANAQK